MLVLGLSGSARAHVGLFLERKFLRENEHEICIGNYRPDLIACGLQQTEERVRGPH
jgi:hypothetical protein